MSKIENIDNIFHGGYIEQMEKLRKEAFDYTIDRKEATEKEIIEYLLNILKKGKI